MQQMMTCDCTGEEKVKDSRSVMGVPLSNQGVEKGFYLSALQEGQAAH